MRKIVMSVLAVFAFGVLAVSAKAQGPEYGPGDTVKISVAFDGPDAGNITQIRVIGNSNGPVAKDQPSFITNLDSTSGNKTGTSTFEDDLPITANMASGDYQITEIRAGVTVAAGNVVWLSYSSAEFPAITFKIRNDHTVNKPRIKSVTQ